MDQFKDRSHAGTELARRLKDHGAEGALVVLGMARGGIPVAFRVAEELDAPLDLFIVRKLGVPGHEELAMGAIATGGIRVINEDVVRHLSIPEDVLARVAAQEQGALENRERKYRGGRKTPNLEGKTVILVDDGVATGASMKAALHAIREQNPDRIVVAVPVAHPSVCEELEELADEVVCLRTPPVMQAIGSWYQDFSQTPDEEVRDLLNRARRPEDA